MNFAQILQKLVFLTALFVFIGCSATPRQESVGEFFDSSLITAKVKAKLIDDRITGGFRIKVNTYKGVVYLSGYVNSDFEKRHAGNLVTDVNGVKWVENTLTVRAEN